MVPWMRGTLKKCFLASSTPLAMAAGHLLGLAVADAHGAVAVADDDERREAEATAALDDLGHAVDRHDALDEGGLLRTRVAPVVAVAAATTAAALSLLRFCRGC
jgi:hypothetical protein